MGRTKAGTAPPHHGSHGQDGRPKPRIHEAYAANPDPPVAQAERAVPPLPTRWGRQDRSTPNGFRHRRIRV